MSNGEPQRGDAGDAARRGRTAFDWPNDAGTTAAVLREMEAELGLRRRRRRRLRAASGAVAVLLACAWLWRPESAPDPAAPAAVPPVVSAPGRQILPDGSVVVLRGDAAVEVNYGAESRRVRLLRGEAIFDVRKDSARPFVVRAAGVDVRAVGTEFAVSVQDVGVEVLVTEGEVAVQRLAGPDTSSGGDSPPAAALQPAAPPAASGAMAAAHPPAEYMLQAGRRIVVQFSAQAAAPEIVAVPAEEMSQRLGWRVPILRFSRTPLRDAVAMLNQHSRVRLVLEGATLNDLPLSGAIRADNVDALLELLAADHGIKAEPRGAAEIVLRPGR